jgi:hypothetical protein
MTEQELLNYIKLFITTGSMPSDDLLLALLSQADSLIKGYLCVDSLPVDLLNPRVSLVLTLYNRLGAEGERKRVEGEVSSTFEDGAIPAAIRVMLQPYRRARVVSPPSGGE